MAHAAWLLLALLAPPLAPTLGLLDEGRAVWTQRRGAAPARRATPPPAPVKVAPEVKCPAPLGVGVVTKRMFCDVMTGGTPAEGILIDLPPHVGPVTLTFDLHNRHQYSDELIRTNRAFTRYTASIGVMAMDVTLLSRAAIQSEFRNAADAFDRIGGGAGPGGVKAIAPTGREGITITVPEVETRVSILGEKLTVDRLDGSATYSAVGRPIAIVSNVMIEYQPPPPKPTPTTKKPAATRKPAR